MSVQVKEADTMMMWIQSNCWLSSNYLNVIKNAFRFKSTSCFLKSVLTNASSRQTKMIFGNRKKKNKTYIVSFVAHGTFLLCFHHITQMLSTIPPETVEC